MRHWRLNRHTITVLVSMGPRRCAPLTHPRKALVVVIILCFPCVKAAIFSRNGRRIMRVKVCTQEQYCYRIHRTLPVWKTGCLEVKHFCWNSGFLEVNGSLRLEPWRILISLSMILDMLRDELRVKLLKHDQRMYPS